MSRLRARRAPAGCAPRRDVCVLKFGSSVLRDAEGFGRAAREISREVAIGRHVVAVVSARADTTDGLLGLTARVAGRPPSALVSSLLRTGEDASVWLLAMAAVEVGLNARALSGDELGLTTRGDVLDAEPVGFSTPVLASSVSAHHVTVVPGFVGRATDGTPTVLGRGGSDLTALFVGVWLDAVEVRLVKDVDGVFSRDPSSPGSDPPVRLATASWAEVARIGNGVVQQKALTFAQGSDRPFRVAALGGRGTLVGPAPTGVES